MGINDPYPEFRAVAQGLLDHRPQIMQIDDDVVKAVPLQQQQVPNNERSTGNRK